MKLRIAQGRAAIGPKQAADPETQVQLRQAGFDREHIDYLVQKISQPDPNALPSLAKMEAIMEADWLGVGPMETCIVKREWSHFWQPMLCMGFPRVSSEYDETDWLRKHKYGQHLAGEYEETFEDVQVGPNKKANMRSAATLFLHTKNKSRVPMVVRADLVGNAFHDPFIKVRINKAFRAEAEAFVDSVDAWVREANIYKNKLLTFADRQLHFFEVPACSWKDVVLPQRVIQQVRRATVDMLKRRDTFYDVGLGVRRSILLDGPPGTGKTQVGRALSNEVYAAKDTEATIIWVSTKSISSPRDIKGLYTAARVCSPTLLILEDVDLIGTARGEAGPDWLLGEMLTQMDGAEDNSGLITVATTNDLAKIDYALTKRPGRFDRLLHVPLPSAEARTVMLKRFAKAHKSKWAKDMTKANPSKPGVSPWTELIAATEGMTGAYLKEVVKTAVIEAVNNDRMDKGCPVLDPKAIAEALELVKESFNRGPRDLGSGQLKMKRPRGSDGGYA